MLATIGLAGCGGNGDGSTPTLTGHVIVTGPSSTVPTRSIAGSTASCPSGKVVIGGGYTTADAAANVFDSFPAANGAGWTVAIKNERQVGGSITMSAVAVCVDRPPAGYEIRNASADLSKGQIKAVSASCADLTWTLVGGGYDSGDSTITNFSSSFDPSGVTSTGVTPPTTWVSEFRSNYSVPSSSDADSYAICVPNSAVSAGYVASPVTTVGATGISTLTQACDTTTPETMVAAGGVTATVSHAATIDTSPPGTGSWTAVVHNPQSNIVNPASLNARVLLVCVAAVP